MDASEVEEQMNELTEQIILRYGLTSKVKLEKGHSSFLK